MITLPFQRKKKEKLRPHFVKKEKTTEKVQKIKQEDFKKEIKESRKKEIGKSNIAFSVLKEPIISEKGTRLEGEGKYLFKVFPQANKNNIKRAIEELYKVRVEKINIITVPAKKIRLGKTEGEKGGYKKAIVTLEKGQKLEVVSK